MKRPGMALALLLSFSELAWIAVFFIAMVFLSETERIQTESETNRARLEAELDRTKAALRKARLTIVRLTIDLGAANAEVERLNAEVKELRKKLASPGPAEEPSIRREIVGLKGDFKRVVILVDHSYSMKQDTGNMPGGNRWEHVRQVVRTWLRHLEMHQCALVTFNHEVSVFSVDDKVFFRVGDDEEGQSNKRALMGHLDGIHAEGRTDMLGALQKAYDLESVDTILLFTDGRPTGPDSGKFDPDAAQEICDLCEDHPDIPVNTIGLGHYFGPEVSNFFLKITESTKGSFLGR